MICPFRHDIDCDDCELYDEYYNEKGGYEACAINEIGDNLKEIAKQLARIAEGLRK